MSTKSPMSIEDYLAEMDPELRGAYPAFLPLFQDWPKTAMEARRMQAALMQKSAPLAGIVRHDIEVRNGDGSGAIPLRIYAKEARGISRGCVLWIHGGGWSAGSIEEDDHRCDQLAD